MRDTEVVSDGVFERSYRLTEDKLLRLQYMPEGLEQLTVQGRVLTLEIQHGNGLAFCSGMHSGVGSVLHPNRVAAGKSTAFHFGRIGPNPVRSVTRCGERS
jgi:hypothetical protein